MAEARREISLWIEPQVIHLSRPSRNMLRKPSLIQKQAEYVRT